ncbi:hypothetical protein D3C73_1500430 [compost metagenome]
MKRLSQSGAISAVRTAMPTDMGTEISIVSTVSDSVLIMKEAAPNFSSSGVQSKEKKN